LHFSGSGIDDRSIIAVLVSAIKALASKVSETAHLVIDTLTAHLIESDKVHAKEELCVDDICVTRDQFAEVFGNQSAAAGAPGSVVEGTPSGSSAPDNEATDAASTTTTSENAQAPSSQSDPSVASAPPALDASNDNAPIDDTLLVDVPAAPEPAPELEAANDNSPAEDHGRKIPRPLDPRCRGPTTCRTPHR
jgi:hypothetical protein